MADEEAMRQMVALEAHLVELIQNPDTVPLNEKLFDDFSLQLTDIIPPSFGQRLLPKLILLLFQDKHEPATITHVATKLLKPVSFTEALGMADESSLIMALKSPSYSLQLLAINVVEKAANSVSDTSILSNMHALIMEFVHTWLSSPSVTVGEKATAAMGKLFAVECANTHGPNIQSNGIATSSQRNAIPHQRLFWRRILNDREIYILILKECSNQALNTGSTHNEVELRQAQNQKSLAQHRLMNILLIMATLDFTILTQSHFLEIDSAYGLSANEHGLLYFAGLHMIDHTDVLLERAYEAFFQDLVRNLSEVNLSSQNVAFLGTLLKRVNDKDPNLKEALDVLVVGDGTEDVEIFLRKLKAYM